MTKEEAIIILQESLRQNKVIQESPNTFFRSVDIADGMKDAERRIEAFNMAITALRAQSKTPPNDPLTLEELREMDGEPVWCINGNGGQWGLVHVFSAEGETYVECVSKTGFTMDKMTYGATGIYAWLAYRRKPEESVHE